MTKYKFTVVAKITKDEEAGYKDYLRNVIGISRLYVWKPNPKTYRFTVFIKCDEDEVFGVKDELCIDERFECTDVEEVISNACTDALDIQIIQRSL